MSEKVWTPLSGGLPPEKLEILRELNEAFQGDRAMIGEYLGRFGWSKVLAANLRVVRRWQLESSNPAPLTKGVVRGEISAARPETSAIASKDGDENVPAGEEDGLKSSFYQVDVSCPFCATAFRPSILRNKSLILSFEYKDPRFPLMVPQSNQAMKGYQLTDPLLRAGIVCPNCLYASSTLGGFATASAVSGTRGLMARLPERKLKAIRARLDETRDERVALCVNAFQSGEQNPWGAARSTAVAAEALLLVSRCAALIAEHEPIEFYRAGDSLLSAARLLSELGEADRERQCLTEARKFFDLSFQFGSVSALPVYLIGVILYHIGDSDGGRTWIGRVMTDRGKLANSSRYKRYCENLIDVNKAERNA